MRKEASNYRDFQRENGGKQVITISIIEISNDVGGGGGEEMFNKSLACTNTNLQFPSKDYRKNYTLCQQSSSKIKI